MENNFEKNDFYLSFNKKLNKNENILLNIIIKKVIDGSGDILEFKESYLKSTLKLDQDNTLINFFDIFMKKKINYHFKQYNLIENNGSIYIFSSYKCSNKIFTITLSKDFIAIFNKDINVFKNYNFNILLRFENLYTRNFFMLITKKNIFNNFIDLNLDDLKKSLEKLDNLFLNASLTNSTPNTLIIFVLLYLNATGNKTNAVDHPLRHCAVDRLLLHHFR